MPLGIQCAKYTFEVQVVQKLYFVQWLNGQTFIDISDAYLLYVLRETRSLLLEPHENHTVDAFLDQACFGW